jgi:N-acetyl-1-D-myo-inositol-2-amino-2-deoxy-alpha-D-glucopyranoside deacetylase
MQHMSSESEQIAAEPLGPEPLGPGATLLSSLFAVLVGLIVGVITTFTHAQFLPWGLIAGLLVVVALVLGFRLVFDSRVVGAAAGLGVVAASAALALPGAGGTVLVLSSPAGWIWALGPAILSAVALLWPRPRARGSVLSSA